MARQAALERAGWVFWRVFGSQWKSNKEFWWRNLQDAMSRLGIEPIGAAVVDERFTVSILVDPFGSSTATDGETSARDIEVEAPQTEQNSALGEIVSPAAEPTIAPTGEARRPEASEDDAAAKAEAADAGAAHGSEEASPTARAEELASPAASAPERRHARQQDLPLEDDLFTRLAEREADASGPLNSTVNGGVTAPESAPAMRETEDSARGAIPIRVGHTVRLEKLGNAGGKLEITLVETGHDPEHGMIGTHTPLGRALLDAEVGDEVEYRAGAYIHKLRVIEVS